MTRIISCVGAKGGTGKSSLSLLLAWELSKNKSKVAILDADIQGTCISAKILRADLNLPLPFEVFSVASKTELCERGKNLAQAGYDYLIIDGNPRSIHEDPELIEIIAKLSDLSLIISRPSPRDLKAQLKYVEMVKQSTSGQVRILWNFFQKQAGAHKEGVPEGEKFLGVKSIKTKIGLRVAYQDVGFSECYIGDLGNMEAVNEVKALCSEVRGICNEK